MIPCNSNRVPEYVLNFLNFTPFLLFLLTAAEVVFALTLSEALQLSENQGTSETETDDSYQKTLPLP